MVNRARCEVRCWIAIARSQMKNGVRIRTPVSNRSAVLANRLPNSA